MYKVFLMIDSSDSKTLNDIWQNTFYMTIAVGILSQGNPALMVGPAMAASVSTTAIVVCSKPKRQIEGKDAATIRMLQSRIEDLEEIAAPLHEVGRKLEDLEAANRDKPNPCPPRN